MRLGNGRRTLPGILLASSLFCTLLTGYSGGALPPAGSAGLYRTVPSLGAPYPGIMLAGFFGFGGSKAAEETTAAATAAAAASAGNYRVPEFRDAVYRAEKTEGNEQVRIDLSSTSEGYVAISAKSDKRLKVQIKKGDIVYTYDLDSGGDPSIYPLQSGDGDYTVAVLENIEGTKYAGLYHTTVRVRLADSFEPFLRPSDYTPYKQNSACVKEAAELARGQTTAVGIVGKIYEYINASVIYDQQKAREVKSGYLPDPDETFATGRGICFDYAALAAAMLRSQGIPTKIIFGHVAPNGTYHAWNMFYTEETGWVTVGYEVSKYAWNRLDLTFTANGQDDTFVGNGTNYTDLYCY